MLLFFLPVKFLLRILLVLGLGIVFEDKTLFSSGDVSGKISGRQMTIGPASSGLL